MGGIVICSYITCICLIASQLLSKEDNKVTVLVLGVISKLFSDFYWDYTYTVTVESMPTVIRHTSVGMFDTVGNLGGVVAPFVAANYGSYGMVGVGGVCLIVVHLVLSVPSTLNYPIPDTYEDALNIKWSLRGRKTKTSSIPDIETKLI